MTQIVSGRSVRVTLPLSRAGFGLGTGILTADGELPIEYLDPGDKIVTHDQGLVALSRIITRTVPARAVVRARPSVLDPDDTRGEVLVSAQQKVIVFGWRAKAMFGKQTALIEAGRLVDGRYMTRLEGAQPVRLFQLAFDDGPHAIALNGGVLHATSTPVPVVAQA